MCWKMQLHVDLLKYFKDLSRHTTFLNVEFWVLLMMPSSHSPHFFASSRYEFSRPKLPRNSLCLVFSVVCRLMLSNSFISSFVLQRPFSNKERIEEFFFYFLFFSDFYHQQRLPSLFLLSSHSSSFGQLSCWDIIFCSVLLNNNYALLKKCLGDLKK